MLRDVPERATLRTWLAEVRQTRPGTHAIRGRAADPSDRPLAGVRIQSGYTHWTTTAADGRFELASLVDGRRTVTASKPGLAFQPVDREVEVQGKDLGDIDFTGSPR